MRELARGATREASVYLTGGATAVLLGWRASTIDVDIKIQPEDEGLLRAIPKLKDELRVNVELASPDHFIPVPAGWETRSRFEEKVGRVAYLHFDLYAQALAKVERGHVQDLEDVRQMLRRGLVEPQRARAYFGQIEPDLYRYPALDPASFRRAVVAAFGEEPA
jgi:hypothetical protein